MFPRNMYKIKKIIKTITERYEILGFSVLKRNIFIDIKHYLTIRR